jgi:hypothetical protein
MRHPFKPIELTLIVLGLIIALFVISEGKGPSGDRVTGTVYDKATNEPLNEVKVGFVLRNDPPDSTDQNGIFYLIIPEDVKEFQLIFVKDGYESKVSEKKYRSQDPVKHDRIFLTKPNPNMKLKEFEALINSEVKIYKSASSPFRYVINANFQKLYEEQWVKEDKEKRAIMYDACIKLGGKCL